MGTAREPYGRRAGLISEGFLLWRRRWQARLAAPVACKLTGICPFRVEKWLSAGDENQSRFVRRGISKLGLTESAMPSRCSCIAYQEEGGRSCVRRNLAELMHDLSLRRRSTSRVSEDSCLQNRDVIRGKEMGTVRLRLASNHAISYRYSEITDLTDTAKIHSARHSGPDCSKIPGHTEASGDPDQSELTRAVFYDACAVMCRRLLECLLLLAFERAAKGESSGCLRNTGRLPTSLGCLHQPAYQARPRRERG